MITYIDQEAIECAELVEALLLERARDPVGQSSRLIGGWQSRMVRIGSGWLGEAMWRRLERVGIKSTLGTCWGGILPRGAECERHRHGIGRKPVAVWCLTNSGGTLHVEDDVVPDRAGQLVVFPQSKWHWVPKVDALRVTVAANL